MATTKDNIDIKIVPTTSVLQMNSMGNGGDTKSTPEDPHTTAGSKDHSQMDSTLFVDDANIVTRDDDRVNKLDMALLSIQNTDPDYQSIKTFLSKPIILRTGSFSISDTFSFLDTVLLPKPLFDATQAAVWVQKLSGVYGVRFDMRFRLVVNANRFQQGRYCLGYVPLCSPERSTSNLKELAVTSMHLATLVQRTTVHHVELDLCNDTTAELLVPFQSVQAFYNFSQYLSGLNDQILGSINIYPYSPLVAPSGSTVAGYTLYASLENVTLFGAASAQSGRIPKKGIADKEIANKNNGPISSAAESISKGFKEFAQIPLLSDYALPVSWIADRVANVASIFGFSKPTQGDSLQKVMILSAPNHNTVDGDSDARPMSYLNKPSVSQIEGLSRTEYDEMDFAYIMRKFAWFDTVSWSNAATAGTVLETINVSNTYFYNVGGASHYQPISFVSAFFSLWRGSIKFRMKIVRTEFHSGRLQIAFYPGQTGNILSGNAAYVHRIIVDVRESPEIEFVVPYISQRLWTRYNYSIGEVKVSVIDPLVAPATVSSSVTILMEVAAGDDYELSVPAAFSQVPSLFTPQSGDVSLLTSTVLGSARIEGNPVLATSVSIGDKVSNFRAMLKRYYPLYFRDMSVASGIRMNVPTFWITPDVIQVLGFTSDTNYCVPDYISVIGSCYAMWRGGVRYRNVVNSAVCASTNTLAPSIVKVYSLDMTNVSKTNFKDWFYIQTAGTAIVPANNHVHIQDLRNNSVVSVEVPQYTTTYARSKCDCLGDTAVATTYRTNDNILSSMTQMKLGFSIPVSSSTSPVASDGRSISNLYRSLADDSNFSVFISVPPMVTITLTGHVAGFA